MHHWQQGDALAAIRRTRWDHVVLQEQSMLGASMVNGDPVISDPARLFFRHVRLFDREVTGAGARTALLQTWGQRGRPANAAALAHAYMTIGKEIGALVIPAGTAWQRALNERPALPLHEDDGSHPAPAGSYLTALVVLCALFDVEPAAVPLTVTGRAIDGAGQEGGDAVTLASVDAATRDLLVRAAWAAWSEVKRAGGYLSGTRPAMPAVAPLPAGRPMPAGALAGTWKGTLRFYAAALNPQPPALVLTLAAQGGSYGGTLTVHLPGGARTQPISDVAVRAQVLTFATPAESSSDAMIRYRAVLTGDDALTGTAELDDQESGALITGSWTARR
jgi:hypothetical protein